MAEVEQAVERATAAANKTRRLLDKHRGLLPNAIVQQLDHLAAEVLTALKACQHGSVSAEAFMSFTASTQETMSILWEAIINLEEQLSSAKADARQLRGQLDTVLLRELACQFENKLYRFVIVGGQALTPVQVHTATVKRLQAEQHKHRKGAMKKIQQAFPNALTSLDQLKEEGTSTAHPWTITDEASGQERPVERGDLQASIERMHQNSIFKGDFEQVLKGLTWLADYLKEPLFVRTVEERVQ